MDRIQAFISSADTGLVAPMWTEMFLSEPVVSALAGADKSVVDQFLAKGVGVAPLLTPTTCAVRIEALTSTAMAASSSMEYSHAWVYSLALLCEVDPGAVALTDKQVEVAFKLKQRWQKQEKNPLQADAADAVRGAAAGPDGAGMAVDAESRAQAETGHDIDDEGAAGPLQWEDQPEPLAEDLKQVMLRFQAGVLSLDPRSIMDSLPVWEGVKAKVEANNYRGDASSKLDRVLASIQRKVLGLMRTYPVLHQGIVEDGELQVLGQQYWGLLLSLENFILSERKAHSIPGSIQPQAPQLFSKDDIKLQAEQASINKVSGYRGAQKGTSVHPPPTEYKFLFQEVFSLSMPGFLDAPHRVFYGSQGKDSSFDPTREVDQDQVDQVDMDMDKVEQAVAPSKKGAREEASRAEVSPARAGVQGQQQPREGWVPTVDPTQKSHASTHSGLSNGHGQKATHLLSLNLCHQSRESAKCAAAHVLICPPNPTASLMEKVLASETGWGDTPLHHRLQINLAWWCNWATGPIVNLIREGIQPQWLKPPTLSVQGRQGPNLAQAQKIMEEYESAGAVKRIFPQDANHLIPWFLLSKPEEGGGPSGDSSRIVERSTNIFKWKSSGWTTSSRFTLSFKKDIGVQRST